MESLLVRNASSATFARMSYKLLRASRQVTGSKIQSVYARSVITLTPKKVTNVVSANRAMKVNSSCAKPVNRGTASLAPSSHNSK